ncbi:MAG: hypothetical protein KF715_08480 [Candidatus Didemnitutus sp.]|nr:hypothetical protein [Candidatus Didemnitutus sp.]
MIAVAAFLVGVLVATAIATGAMRHYERAHRAACDRFEAETTMLRQENATLRKQLRLALQPHALGRSQP